MKKILWMACSALLLQACEFGGSDKKGFRVNGKLKDTTFSLLYLEEVPLETNRPAIVDSVKPNKNGSFTLKAPAAEDRIYYVRAAQQTYPLFAVVNDSKSAQVEFSFERIDGQLTPSYTVTGSPASSQLHDFSVRLNDGMRNILKQRVGMDTTLKKGGADSLVRGFQERIFLEAKSLFTLTDSTLKSSTITPSTYVIILGFYQSAASNPGFGLQGFSLEEIDKRLEKLGGQFPKHTGLATFRKQLAEEIRKSKGLAGMAAPEFTLPDVNGNPVSIKSFRGKWLLIDFWASWCKPCRMENPNVVAAYNKFKDKNFTILGVSLDRPEGRNDWTKAIQDDKLTWTQVSELKFWESSVVSLYNIQGIPYNVLVDPQGNVVAEDLRGPNLTKKLSEVLK
ncbi:MAG: redoxin domain-containing protein [Bacteroidota bacterium]